MFCSTLHSPSPRLNFNPSSLSPPLPSLSKFPSFKPKRITKSNLRCRAVLSDDAPFAAAIGACMLSSLVFPVSVPPEEEDADSALTSTDTRLAVMGILSFVPYFNWLSWIFAWMDTGKRRYAVYALVYLAPYLRSNLSLSPEESWLPIASILFCIVHIQLEAGIRNGDIKGFQLFRNVTDQSSSSTRKNSYLNQYQANSKEVSNSKHKNLPPVQEQSRNISGWEDPERPIQKQHRQPLDEDLDDDDGGEKRSRR